MLYLCMNKQINDMEKLNVKKSNFKPEMDYNEWAKKFNVGSGYVQPTKYFQGHTNWSMKPIGVAKYINETPIERFFRVLFNKFKF